MRTFEAGGESLDVDWENYPFEPVPLLEETDFPQLDERRQGKVREGEA